MSRIGKLPITVPKGVEVKIDKNKVTVKGPKGHLSQDIDWDMKLTLEDGIKHCMGRPVLSSPT